MSAGCDDFYYTGTNVGYLQCLEKNKDVGLSGETLRRQCLSKHQHWGLIPQEGEGGYSYTNGVAKFGGFVKNLSTDRIITSIVILVKHKENVDSAGEPLSERLQTDTLWIQPDDTGLFEFSDLKFKPNLSNKQKGLFEWGVVEMGYLKIKIR